MEVDLLNYSDKRDELTIYVDDSLSDKESELTSVIKEKVSFVDLQNLKIDKGSFLIISSSKVGIKFKKTSDYFSVIFKEDDLDITFKKGEELFCLSSDVNEYSELLSIYSYLKSEQLVNVFISNAHKKALEVYKDAAIYLGNDSYFEKHINVYDLFFNIRLSINNSLTISELMTSILESFQSLELFEEIKLLKNLDLSYQDFEQHKDNDLISLEWIEDDLFLSFKQSENSDKSDNYFYSFCLVLIIELIDKLYLLNDLSPSTAKNKNIWEGAIEAIPFPLALVSESGDIVIYNSKFTGLNLPARECLKLIGQEVVQVGSDYYDLSVSRLETRDGFCQIFVFQNEKDTKDGGNFGDVKTVSSTELGIISSSIAHELNNPLAGVLAAISLLELEQWDEESEGMLLDMKNSAGRCKGLVEIFLSFSKSGTGVGGNGSVRESATQSLDLLRFRMIESGVRLKLDIKNTEEKFENDINLSLCTMIFYLLLGEVLTDFNHYQVVTGEKNSVINATFSEHKDHVSLRFSHKLRLQTFLEESKLINYLVGVQGMNLEVVHNGFILKSWSLV
jgi:hypothetical protein